MVTFQELWTEDSDSGRYLTRVVANSGGHEIYKQYLILMMKIQVVIILCSNDGLLKVLEIGANHKHAVQI